MDKQEVAETVALQAFAWLMAEDEVRDGFLAASGAATGDLAALARLPEFLGAVLDYILQDDARVLAVAGSVGIAPERLAQVRAALPGGDVPDWT